MAMTVKLTILGEKNHRSEYINGILGRHHSTDFYPKVCTARVFMAKPFDKRMLLSHT